MALRIGLSACFLAAVFAVAGAIVIGTDADEAAHAKLAADPAFECVGLVSRAGKPAGTGELVAPNWVLTARHVLKADSESPDKLSRIRISFGDKTAAVKRVVFPSDQTKFDARLDMCLAELEEKIEGVPPCTLYEGPSEFGQPGILVGYGSYAKGPQLYKSFQVGVKHAAENMIDRYAGKIVGTAYGDDLLICDFDHPTNPALSVTGDSKPLPLEGIGTGGDSGGALFIRTAQGVRLAGMYILTSGDITSTSPYGDYCGAIPIRLHLDWIRRTIGSSR